MPDYQLGKIYQIVCLTTGQKYVGSTTQKTLAERLAGHVGKFKCWKKGTYTFTTSFTIIEHDNFQIELLEAYPCNSKDELNAREGYYIRTIDCVNKSIMGRTHKEWYDDNPEYDKAYREANKDKIAEQKKQYYEANKTEIVEYQKEYYEANKTELIAKVKLYSEANKTKIAEYQKQYNEKNKNELAEQKKAYYEKNKTELVGKNKAYRDANKEDINRRRREKRQLKKNENAT